MKLPFIKKYFIYALHDVFAKCIKSDKLYVQIDYFLYMGKRLRLNPPVTFNEKLQWLKLYANKEEYTQMVDKYEVKKYIADIIGEEYVIPTLGVWERFEDIDFEQLPNQFVLKCTHDSGGLVICKDKSQMDMNAARKKLNKCLARNYYYQTREMPYKNVKPRIIAEKYMVDESGTELKDYKFFCFNGKVKCLFILVDRFINTRLNFFDRNFKLLPFERGYPNTHKTIEKPLNYDKMVELAEFLSKEIPFVRIDFYNINGQIYFGEFTFTPGNGVEPFVPDAWDKKVGEWITCI
jgi:hypothetical protein